MFSLHSTTPQCMFVHVHICTHTHTHIYIDLYNTNTKKNTKKNTNKSLTPACGSPRNTRTCINLSLPTSTFMKKLVPATNCVATCVTCAYVSKMVAEVRGMIVISDSSVICERQHRRKTPHLSDVRGEWCEMTVTREASDTGG